MSSPIVTNYFPFQENAPEDIENETVSSSYSIGIDIGKG